MAIDQTVKMIQDMLNDHRHDIDQAYIRTEDALTVSLSVKYAPNVKTGAIDIDVNLSFVSEKIKDNSKASISEGQGSLYELQDKVRKGEVTISVGGEPGNEG
jgi:hypothetical protein